MCWSSQVETTCPGCTSRTDSRACPSEISSGRITHVDLFQSCSALPPLTKVGRTLPSLSSLCYPIICTTVPFAPMSDLRPPVSPSWLAQSSRIVCASKSMPYLPLTGLGTTLCGGPPPDSFFSYTPFFDSY
jgi:hypothetical protein